MGNWASAISARGRFGLAVVLGWVCLFQCSSSGFTDALPTGPEMILHRLASLRNLEVDYDQTIERTPTKKGLAFAAATGKPVLQGTYLSSNHFSFLDGRARFEVKNSTETLDREHKTGGEDTELDILIMSFERTERYSRFRGNGRPSGSISNPENTPWPDFSVIDIALGLRGNRQQSWLDEKTISQGQVEVDKTKSTATLHIPSGKGMIHSWQFSLIDEGLPMIRYTFSDPRRDGVYAGEL